MDRAVFASGARESCMWLRHSGEGGTFFILLAAAKSKCKTRRVESGLADFAAMELLAANERKGRPVLEWTPFPHSNW
jgi:hypothetical protein